MSILINERQSSGAEAPRANRAVFAILNIQNETEDDESHPQRPGICRFPAGASAEQRS